jgi:glycosyltransferase involved in cell wall biosynthesis
MTQFRVLIITHDVIGENMAGPAIRCWEFARVLSREAQVTLATPHPTALSPDTFELVQYDAARLEALASRSDLMILSGYALWLFPFLKTSGVPLVVDIYDPFLLESLPLLAGQPDVERNRRHVDVLDALTDLLVWGDFFVCSSERQRDYWLGWLNTLDRINPLTYDDDPSLRRLIDIVAFGLPDTIPQHTHAVLKGVRPGIESTDHVIVWGGGVYNWFDPLTLIRAMERVSAQRSDVKLIFLGIRHPNPDVGGGEMAEQTVALSQELNLYEKQVFFNDWTPYNERQNYLLEADVGISLHFAHLETHFSFRTRLLDYIWAALPIIVTRGDVLSSLIERQWLGWAVDYESVDDVTAAILESADTPRSEFRERFAAVAPQLSWDTVMQPLIAFCREPWRAPDRQRARSGLQSLPALKLISQINALQRDIKARNERVNHLEHVLADSERMVSAKSAEIANLNEYIASLTQQKNAELERLQEHIHQIQQGRVMRLLNGINHIIKGPRLG